MRTLLKLEAPADVYPYHRSFYLEERSSSSSSNYSRARPPCNKQTINAGDNPCPSFQSPLPYMLAGLAAMVLLVVISLMILACSYLRGYFSTEDTSRNSSGGGGVDPENPKAASLQASHNGFGTSPEKIVVILAGQDKPTHLAQPVRVSEVDKQSVDSVHASDHSHEEALEMVNQHATPS